MDSNLHYYLDVIWGNEQVLLYLAGISVLAFVLSLFLIPLLVVRIPSDYFSASARHRVQWAKRHFMIRWLLLLVKNLFGTVFLLLGVVMLFLPGQGLLTIFISILLLDFPGKYQFERWLISRASINKAVNWLRQRAGCAPLKL